MRNAFTAGNLAIAATCLALGFSTATALTFWHSDKWPAFFGTLTAALIAGIVLIFGHYYQDQLARKRDRDALMRQRDVEAIDMCFWLQHCDHELEFIEGALSHIRDRLQSEEKPSLEIPLETFREVITPAFYRDLLDRAKAAAKLAPEISGLISSDLYKTFTTSDRIFLLRQAPSDYRPSLEAIEKYIFILGRRRSALQEDAKLIEAYLINKGTLPDYSEG